MMLGRAAECAEVDRMLAAAREGRSGALVISGEPGIGKTTLLRYAEERAADLRILRTQGFETESEIPFAGLADLVGPVLHLLPTLPEPQAAALRSALALGPPVAGDRFSACAAVLGLLAAATEDTPALVVVDDLQWLDASSRECLLFAARRLQAEGIALLLATREDTSTVNWGLRRVPLTGLSRDDTAALCREIALTLPPEACGTLYEATAGNPLGVIELAAAWHEHPGTEPASAPIPLSGSRIERALRGRLEQLPERSRQALVLAAAAAGGDTGVVLLAAEAIELSLADFAPAETAGLVVISDRRVEFRHPILRSVAYHSAAMDERCRCHLALAGALADVPGDAAADARAWHLAAATLAPDEEVAALLEQAAVRARGRSGYVAAARAFGHAARLSPSAARPRQLLRAARCWQLAGRNSRVLPLLEEALPLTTDAAQRALIEHMTAYVRMWRGRPEDALRDLMRSAERVERVDPGRAALMYADACIPYFMTGRIDDLRGAVRRSYHLGRAVGGTAELVATVAMAGNLVLQRDRAGATRLLRGCHQELCEVNPFARAQEICHAALIWTWLDGYAEASQLIERVIASARQAGGLGILPQALSIASELYFRLGRWSDARACAAESVRLAEETRQADLYGLFFTARLDAVQGRDDECLRYAARTTEVADRLGVGCMSLFIGHALGLLAVSRGDTKEAIVRLEEVNELPVTRMIRDPAVVPWVFDLVECYIRDGRVADAEALLAEHAPDREPVGSLDGEPVGSLDGEPVGSLDGEPVGSLDGDDTWAAAAAARCRALLAGPEQLEEAFQRALAEPACHVMPFERARTEMCLGERLRRSRQRTAARVHLRAALEIFERLGASPWAERTRLELRATGETIRRDARIAPRLTPQELQVALVVGRGATNQEAATALFLSQKTIEYHLSNIYRKTGIKSRGELAALAE